MLNATSYSGRKRFLWKSFAIYFFSPTLSSLFLLIESYFCSSLILFYTFFFSFYEGRKRREFLSTRNE